MIDNIMEMLVIVLLPFSAIATMIVIVILLMVYLLAALSNILERRKA